MVIRRLKEMRRRNLVLFTAAVTVVLGLLIGYFTGVVAIENKLNLPFLPTLAKCGIPTSTTNITAKVEQYIDNNFLGGYGLEAKIVNTTQMNGLLSMGLTILSNGTKVDSGEIFVTNDGELMLIGNAYNMSAPIPASTTQTQQTQQSAATVQKSDKPTVSLYVMSFCPYGNLAENTMSPVYALLKDKVDWQVHYIVSVSGNSVSSLHGQPEVDQNEREACVLRDYGMDKWWAFTTYVNNNCGSNGACWETGANVSGLNATKIKNCVNDSGLSLMKTEADATDIAGASGSPTLIINGGDSSAVYQYGNSELYKKTICDAFNIAPNECSTVLNNTASQASGSCGS